MLNRLLASALPLAPKRAVHLVARRYVAGSTLEAALDCVEKLNRSGARATVDILGEYAHDAADVERTQDAYLSVLRRLEERKLDSSVSVKLTALGLKIDRERCAKAAMAICEEARSSSSFVRLDMEDTSCTDDTLEIYRTLAETFENVGPVLQAYLRRTVSDARSLAATRANVRLCKGIYVEKRELAFKDREIIRLNYTRTLRVLLESGCYVGIATHDELLVFEALRVIDELGVERDGYEFQMLLGVDEELRRILIDAGHHLRVYVPYGKQWYEYSMRRLKENPEIAGHVARATLGRMLGREKR